MTSQFEALRASVARLRRIVSPLDNAQLERQAYPTEWRIADVMSHIGSGAVIMEGRVTHGIAGTPLRDDFAPGVWDEWNAKSPRRKTDDALAADAALVERLANVGEPERSAFSTQFGPMTIGFDELIGFRLNEHAMHTWDIEVTLDPAATLHPEQTVFLIDNLALIAGFTAKTTGSLRTIAVRTVDPARQFTIQLAAEAVTFSPDPSAAERPLVLPAEAFARLVYGRLDTDHTPAFEGDTGSLDELRKVFPGP